MLCILRAFLIFFSWITLHHLSWAANPGDILDLVLRDGRTFEKVEVLRDEGDSLWIKSGKTIIAVKRRDILSEKLPPTKIQSAPDEETVTITSVDEDKKGAIPSMEQPKPKEETLASVAQPDTEKISVGSDQQSSERNLVTPILTALVLASLVVIIWLVVSTRTGRRRVEELEQRYKPVIDIDQALVDKQTELEKVTNIAAEKNQEILKLNQDLASLKKSLALLESEADMVACGHYKPQFPFTISEEYKEAITAIRERQRAMIKEKSAATCPHKWTINGSEAEGRKATQRTLRLLLREVDPVGWTGGAGD
jgi:hypothetical protein